MRSHWLYGLIIKRSESFFFVILNYVLHSLVSVNLIEVLPTHAHVAHLPGVEFRAAAKGPRAVEQITQAL